ncbi:hypothetical protein B0H19DRAFT_1226204 [Mycena capillaripes]|nr:hypothetical protein B0H19DRAFT_1226204 [Mycena capillaripes]
MSSGTQAPVRTILALPNELVVAIAAAGQEGHIADLETPFKFKSEWTWSQVSCRLREAIIGAPTLWTFVEANLNAEGSVEISKLYLERSRTCHISAHLQYLRAGDDLDSEQIVAADRLRQIFPHIYRIWLLSIRLRGEECELLATLHDIAAPNLQRLEIFNVDYDSRTDQGYPVRMFAPGAPSLTFVKMHGFRLSRVPLWTASLTHLELSGGEGPGDADNNNLLVAAQCPLLVHLYLDMGWLQSIPERRCYIPFLKLLRISISDGSNQAFLGLLDLFDTPALAEFIITDAHGDQIFALLTSTSLHSFPALTTLCCVTRSLCSCEDDISFSSTVSSPLIQIFPKLSSITLVNLCFTHNLLSEIFGPATPPWPLLKTVTLYPKPSTLDDVRDALQNAMRPKRRRGQALPHFRLSPDLLLAMEDRVDTEMFDPTEIIDTFC